jgi:hypothetical protein
LLPLRLALPLVLELGQVRLVVLLAVRLLAQA